MAITYGESLLDAQKYFLVTISRYYGNDIAGIVYHNLHEYGVEFANLVGMVKAMEEIFDQMDYPSKCVERRSFQKNRKSISPQKKMEALETRLQDKETLAALRVQIRHRFRGSWQGSVEDTSTGQQRDFESFLELLRLIEQAIPTAGKGTLAPDFEPGKHIIRLKGETFIMQLLFKKHGTWQGSLYWSDRRLKVEFRSYLELLFLISEAWDMQKEKQEESALEEAANR